MKDEVTTIQVKKKVIKALNNVKKYKRETYSDVISELIEFVQTKNEKKEFDKFVMLAQQEKMKELWDNKYDEVWENA
jgi:predicted CopG family antitoxin